ncbi:Pre-mRNA-processing factor 39 [Cyphellophora attinorum]|uniref:Pre-mRNA-processing factor 39 n=1 Tax=Cyphellophora attinorum TaxID=1664694 RepID=A0A0N1P0Y6_9EURO|nr:Pre-mRNA-processing factor 39 [Phialophora attinorum]KPI39752.1 Pre-mRNA-processing factor 39 [Phialophora attinorum]
MDAFGSSDEESVELRKLLSEMHADPDNYEIWEKLVRTVETLEGGINRNSSSQAISAVRDVYDRFLMKFPLFFGYWKKYADLEFSIAGTEAAEMVYERGVASIINSADLWTNYCSFKTETSHDPDIIRELFERGAAAVGLDFLSHIFWDKYIEFEERMEQPDRIFALLSRIIHIPMHQYARYFEKYRQLAQSRPVQTLVPPQTFTKLQMDVENEGLGYKAGRSAQEVEIELRRRSDAEHLKIFQSTQAETTKRWTYESEIKRPYFHVTDLEEGQLENWRKYLDFEEGLGDYARTQFLYERCLVVLAVHEEFWLRYARWMFAQQGKEEEVRNIYQRAACTFVPIALPNIRLQYAFFEEMTGRVDVAKDIHEAILVQLPSHIETIISLANLTRRHGTVEDAVAVFAAQLDSPAGSAENARAVFQNHQAHYTESEAFWKGYLQMEIAQPTTPESEKEQYDRIRAVADSILHKSKLAESTIQSLIGIYMAYLLEKGGKDAAKEYLNLDREINGPASVRKLPQTKASATSKAAAGINGQQPPVLQAAK